MKEQYEIQDEDRGKRLDVFLTEHLSNMTRSHLQRLIEGGDVQVNNTRVKAGYKLRKTDAVEVTIPEPKELEILPERIPLEILYEDSDLIVINKPKGMVVHPAAGHSSGTLVNALLFHCGSSLSGINGVLRPGIVHRIDRDTTGVMIACKNDMAHHAIAAQLKAHSITRRYRAIVHGVISEEGGSIDAPIARDPAERKRMKAGMEKGKPAVTHYRVLQRFVNASYVECRLETGRTHQIRVHMASIGHPLLGDTVYGSKKNPMRLEGQTLHAMVLGFVHPRSGQYMEFTAPLPDYFERLLKIL